MQQWQRGEGLKSINRVFGKGSSSIFAHPGPFGGIRPPPRRRSGLALTLVEREEISHGLVNGCRRGVHTRSLAGHLSRTA